MKMLALTLLFATTYTAFTGGVATAPTNEVIRFSEGSPNCKVTMQEGGRVDVINEGGLEVAVSEKLDAFADKHASGWVFVTNLGDDPVEVTSEAITLQILKPKSKIIRAENPEKLSKAVERAAYSRKADLTTPNCPVQGVTQCMPSASAASEAEAVLHEAEQQKVWIAEHALKDKRLQPHEHVQGAVFFQKENKMQEYELRLRVGGATYEFPESAGK